MARRSTRSRSSTSSSTKPRRSCPPLVDAYDAAKAEAARRRRRHQPVVATVVQPALGTSLLHDIAAGTAPWPVEALYVASVSALNGPHVMIDLAVDDIVAGIDWDARAATG